MCLCVALRSGWSRLSLDVTSNIVTWPLELYYSWDQCWDSTSPDTGEPVAPEALPSVAPSSSAFLRRLFSLRTSLLCWDWVVNMKSESVHLKGWQPVRDSGGETPNSDQGCVSLCYMSHSSYAITLFPSFTFPCVINTKVDNSIFFDFSVRIFDGTYRSDYFFYTCSNCTE